MPRKWSHFRAFVPRISCQTGPVTRPLGSRGKSFWKQNNQCSDLHCIVEVLRTRCETMSEEQPSTATGQPAQGWPCPGKHRSYRNCAAGDRPRPTKGTNSGTTQVLPPPESEWALHSTAHVPVDVADSITSTCQCSCRSSR